MLFKKSVLIRLFMILPLFPQLASGECIETDNNRSGDRNYISYTVNEKSWLSLSGTTNVNTFECLSGSGSSNGYILTEANITRNTINLTDARISVQINSFNCKNPLINRDIYNALGGGRNPYIEIIILEIIPGAKGFDSSGGNITVKVIIKINGVSREKELDIGWHSPDGFEYHFNGSKELLMSEFAIEPPSPALGIVRVDDRITVYFNYVVHTGIISRMD